MVSKNSLYVLYYKLNLHNVLIGHMADRFVTKYCYFIVRLSITFGFCWLLLINVVVISFFSQLHVMNKYYLRGEFNV